MFLKLLSDFIFIGRFFKIWSNILNYSTPTESITRTNTAAEGRVRVVARLVITFNRLIGGFYKREITSDFILFEPPQ